MENLIRLPKSVPLPLIRRSFEFVQEAISGLADKIGGVESIDKVMYDVSLPLNLQELAVSTKVYSTWHDNHSLSVRAPS
jgi:hypothetical protein